MKVTNNTDVHVEYSISHRTPPPGSSLRAGSDGGEVETIEIKDVSGQLKTRGETAIRALASSNTYTVSFTDHASGTVLSSAEAQWNQTVTLSEGADSYSCDVL